MNQILEYDTNRGNFGQNGNSDKVVRIFAILLISLAVFFIVIAVKGNLTNKNNLEKEQEDVTYADIEVNVIGTKATISVTHDKIIQKLIYSWNNGREEEVKVNRTSYEKEIDVPYGNNMLHLKVIDENNKETIFDKETNADQGIDIINPIINLSIVEETSLLKITATDDTELSFITYRWNDGEEEKIEVGDDNKKIEAEIEILKGENDLIVIAVDANNNTTTEKKKFKGLTSPIISVAATEDNKFIKIRANDEYGIESVKYKFNGEEYLVDIGNDTPNDIEFQQELNVGKNTVYLVIKNIQGVESKYNEEIEYTELRVDSANSDESEDNNLSEENNNSNE